MYIYIVQKEFNMIILDLSRNATKFCIMICQCTKYNGSRKSSNHTKGPGYNI